MKQSRMPTQEEAQLIDWLLRNGDGDYRKYADQLPRLRVIGSCGCGCPTIDLTVEGAPPPEAGKKDTEILADFHGMTPEGVSVGIILFAANGILSCLEAYSIAGVDWKFTFPRTDDLKSQDEMITEQSLGALPRARGGHSEAQG